MLAPTPRALILLTVVLLAAAGCQNRHEAGPDDAGAGATTVEADLSTPEGSSKLWPPERPYPLIIRNLDLAGMEDYRNRYAATVQITTSQPMPSGTRGLCNGVLLHPRLVLTAGHCVCVRRPITAPGAEDLVLIDGTSCSQTPRVTMQRWGASKEDDFIPSSSWIQEYQGIEVRPHPAFQLLIQNGQVVSSRADLALIILETPVDRSYAPLELAEEEVRAGETFVHVGSTGDDFQERIAGDRRFIRYKATRLMEPGGDRILFEQPKRDLFKGDSGGPCVRESPKGPVLVGISNRGLGMEATFTSIHPYRVWLRSAIQSVKPK